MGLTPWNNGPIKYFNVRKNRTKINFTLSIRDGM